MLTDIVMRLFLLWNHMLGCPLIIWSFLQISFGSLPPAMMVLLRSLNRFILLLFIFCCLMVRRYMIYFMYHNWKLPLVLYLVHRGLLPLLFGLPQMTLASLRLRISWIHDSYDVVASFLRNFLLSGVGMTFLKPLGSHLQITNCPDVLSSFC